MLTAHEQAMGPEAAMFLGALEESLDSIVQRTAGLDADVLNWRPPGANTNSLYAMTAHAASRTRTGTSSATTAVSRMSTTAQLSSPKRLIRQRSRGPFRGAQGAHGGCRRDDGLAGLGRTCEHQRLGQVPGRAVLLQAARHAAEHAGEAALTRELLDAR